ncbi:MAG TPA: hypothetical protein PLJ47_09785 [Candidatus Hydrogenedentes bacterium]|nr:hypothetical protein [Candidatus Hydrogenedentota bacterium]HRK34870.1 hypothetical protein [Candidatus Hydrogenedentota bacterium]
MLPIDILPQPDEITCGPTCLHALYGFYKDKIPLERVIHEVPALDEGGTLGAYLGSHALKRGYSATIYTYNLRVFDPTWFASSDIDIAEKIEARMDYKRTATKLQRACQAYIEFLQLGGEVRFEDLTGDLIESFLAKSLPIITGLSSTFLYRCARETPDSEYDDVRGDSQGHFVVLCGFDRKKNDVIIADPLQPNPFSEDRIYAVDIERAICSILLGVLTYDANLLIIEPRKKRGR